MEYKTWKDIKLATLQKMFASNGLSIQKDSSNTEYINSMPQACNEALQLLSTAGKFIIGSHQIVVAPIDNLIPDNIAEKTYSIVDDTLEFKAKGAQSFYFKANGLVTVRIYIGGVEYTTLEADFSIPIEVNSKTFTAYRGLIPNETREEVKITFTSKYPANVNNIALYGASFPTNEDVEPYEEFIKYDLSKLVDNFYQLEANEIYYEGDTEPRYILADECYQEANKTLVLKRSMPGIYTVYYKQYPEQVTSETPDTYEFILDPEVVTLIPLYMASQLYKDDDNAIATAYRNEFETAFERLSQASTMQRRESFTSESGWC